MNNYTVTQLNRHIKHLLENQVSTVCVTGEISNLSRPASGHYYFTLKDNTAQVRCCFFKNRHRSDAHAILKNGQKIELSGKPSLYEARGDYQLIVESVADAGLGDLHRQFELLKKKLSALGLFDPENKNNIPRFPTNIGVITSPTGAAIRDILTTLGRRYPLAPVIIYPTEVQGAHAAPQIIKALNSAIHDNRCDVLLLARGGGSIEDLWAFNDENLAYAINKCPTPIVSGVGHETDFTIADFVSDIRTATPTAAAETITPDQQELIAWFNAAVHRLSLATRKHLQHKQLLLNHASQKLQSPARLIQSYWQSLDYLRNQLVLAVQKKIAGSHHHQQLLTTKLQTLNPLLKIKTQKQQLAMLQTTLIQTMHSKLAQLTSQLRAQCATLHAVSPLATLDRGYAIATKQTTVLTNSKQTHTGDVINIRLATGSLVCEVINKGE